MQIKMFNLIPNIQRYILHAWSLHAMDVILNISTPSTFYYFWILAWKIFHMLHISKVQLMYFCRETNLVKHDPLVDRTLVNTVRGKCN
jgi:hypothetical protein